MKRIMIGLLLVLLAATAVWAAGGVEPELPEILVESEWLVELLDHENLIVIDTGRSAEEYAAGHIPGAVFLDRQEYYETVAGTPGMFSGVDPVSEALRDIGVNNDSVIVVYDPGHGLWATRLFWTLEVLGHQNVAVLNGGIGKWTDESRTLSQDGPREREVGTFEPAFNAELVISGEDLAEDLSEITVVDTRSAGEFAGTDARADRGGHIPGAVHIDWVLNNTGESVNTFLPVDELDEFYAVELDGNRDGRIVTHCQTGVRGAHTYFVLRLLGYEEVALYDGSWAEWGNNEAFPVSEGS